MLGQKNKDFFRSSVSIYIENDNIEKWKSTKEKSSLASSLLNGHLDGTLIKVELPPEISEVFANDPGKEYLINKLLTEYYKENIMFIDEFQRLSRIYQTMGESNISIESVSRTLANKNIIRKTAESMPLLKKDNETKNTNFETSYKIESSNVDLNNEISKEDKADEFIKIVHEDEIETEDELIFEVSELENVKEDIVEEINPIPNTVEEEITHVVKQEDLLKADESKVSDDTMNKKKAKNVLFKKRR